MSDDVRADARRLLHGITPGKWAWTKYDDQYEIWTQDKTDEPGDVADNVQHLADAEFIAAAPTLVDRLLTQADRLQSWKDDALPVIFGLQDLGRALDIPLGHSITGPIAVERAQALLAERDAALALLQQVRELHHVTCEHDGDNCVYGINCPLAFCVECDTGTVCETAHILDGGAS